MKLPATQMTLQVPMMLATKQKVHGFSVAHSSKKITQLVNVVNDTVLNKLKRLVMPTR